MKKQLISNNSGDHYKLEAITAEEMQEAIADSLACAMARIIYTQIKKEQEKKALSNEGKNQNSDE